MTKRGSQTNRLNLSCIELACIIDSLSASCALTCVPGYTAGQQSTEAHAWWLTGQGDTCRERQRKRVNCPCCNHTVQASSLCPHIQRFHDAIERSPLSIQKLRHFKVKHQKRIVWTFLNFFLGRLALMATACTGRKSKPCHASILAGFTLAMRSSSTGSVILVSGSAISDKRRVDIAAAEDNASHRMEKLTFNARQILSGNSFHILILKVHDCCRKMRNKATALQ